MPEIITSRRSFLLGSVSTGALMATGWPLAVKGVAIAETLPETLYV